MHTDSLSDDLQLELDNVAELVKTNNPHRLQESLKFLQKLPSEIHWLSSDGLNTAVLCTLETFEHEGPALKWLKSKLRDQFGKCWICARTFHKLKADLRPKRVLEYELDELSEDSLFASLDAWDVERLSFSLNRANEMLKQNPNLTVQSLPSDFFSSIYECLLEPGILRNEQLYEMFKSVFLAVQRGGRFLRMSEDVVPGMITFIFSEDQNLRKWAEKSFSRLSRVIQFQEFNATLQAELNRSLRIHLLEPQSREAISRILNGLPHILKVVDQKVIIEYLCSSDCDMARLIAAQAMNVENGPLIVLRSLSELLQKLGAEFWSRVSPIIPISTMEGIMGSKKVQELFEHPDLIGTLEFSCNESDLTEWILPFIRSTDRVSRQRTCGLLLSLLLERFQHPRFPPKARREYAYYGLETLKLLLEDASIKFSESSESNNILQKDTQEIALKYVKPVVDLACPLFPADSPMDAKLQNAACQVVCFALSIDCSRLQKEFVAFTKDKTLPIIKLSTIYTDLYMHTMGSITVNNSDFPLQVLRSIRPSAFVDTLENSTDNANIKDFNICVEEVRKATRSILQRVEEFDNSSVKALFKSRDCCITVASLLFSPDNGIYHANLDLVKQGFDATGKTEALKGMLELSFEATIEGLASAMSTISSLGLFSPVPRLVRTCLSVIEIISSPSNGLIVGVQLDHTSRLVLQKLWREIWRMLENLFSTTPSWSNKIARDLITEFMRDALELAGKLFIVLQPFGRAIGGFDDSSSDLASTTSMIGLERNLLQSCSSAVRAISSWLRLNDDSLLTWCLNLLTSIIHRLAQARLQLDENSISYLEGIAHHRKGFKNKLDEEACAKIILAISELTGGIASDNTHSVGANVEGRQSILVQSRASQLGEIKTGGMPETISGLSDVASHDSDNDERMARELSESSSLSSTYNNNSRRNLSALPIKTSIGTHTSTYKSTGKPTALDRVKANIRLENQERKVLGGPPKLGANGMLKTKISDLRAVRRAPVQPSKYVSKRQDTSSPSESSDSDTEGLFSEPKIHKSPKIRKVEKKTIQTLRSAVIVEEMQSVKRQMQRDKALRNARARVTPDLSPLYRKILHWNFDHDGDMPPNIQVDQLQGVSNAYPDAAKYYQTFEPLLLCEGWEQVRQAVEQQAYQRFKCTVMNRCAVDDFVDLYVQVSHKTVTNNSLTDSDLVILYCGNKDGPSGQRCFGKITSLARKKDLADLTVRCLPNTRMLETLRPKAEVEIMKLFNMTPLEREYAALLGLQFYDMCEEIIHARAQPLVAAASEDVKIAMDNYGVNEPQARAIIGAVQNEGFSLIQGIIREFLENAALAVQSSVPGHQPSAPQHTKKLLVCAPSNAAVDEIVMRLKALDSREGKIPPRLVRVGRSDAVNASVRDVTLEELVDAEMTLQQSEQPDAVGPDIAALREQMSSIRGQLDKKRKQLELARAAHTDTALLQEQIRILTVERNTKSTQIDEHREKSSNVKRRLDFYRRQIQSQILGDADVICATLSGAGSDLLSSMSVNFETVIIDEAAQSNELGALIPLKYGCRQCVLVGDPNQLPPTILSKVADKAQYSQSLFVRMQNNRPDCVHLLNIQYRMHPHISLLPSRLFYDSKLINGADMEKVTARDWHNSSVFSPYRFFDVTSQEQQAYRTHSIMNRAEVNVAIKIYKRLTADFAHIDFEGRIGIVTPYKQQLVALKNGFCTEFGGSILDAVDFNTIDGFQGQEKDIIILSCVRAGGSQTLGFLRDVRRMNVGLTRAKSSLFILGHSQSLETNVVWRDIIHDAQTRNMYTKVSSDTFLKSTVLDDGEIPMIPSVGPDHKRKPKKISSTKVPQSIASPHKLEANLERPQDLASKQKQASSHLKANGPFTSSADGPDKANTVPALMKNDEVHPASKSFPKDDDQTLKPHTTASKPVSSTAKRKQPPSLFIHRKKPSHR